MEQDIQTIARQFDLQPKSVTRAENAVLSKVFILDNAYVLRARALWEGALEKFIDEQTLVEAVRPHISLELPTLLITDSKEKFLIEGEFIWTAYPIIAGDILCDWWAMDKFPDAAYEKSFRALATLHASTKEKLGNSKGFDFLDEVRVQLESMNASLEPGLYERAQKALEKTRVVEKELLESDLVFVHGDFHPGNIVFKNGEIKGLLDTDWASYGSPLTDLGYAVMNFMRDCSTETFRFDDRKFSNFLNWYGLPQSDIPLLSEYMILYALYDLHGFTGWNISHKDHLVPFQHSVLADFCARF